MDVHSFRPLLAALLMLFSASFSGSETAIFSITRTKLKELQAKGDKIVPKVNFFRENSHHTLISILTGNELVNISFSAVMAAITLQIGIVDETASIIFTTLLLLILGEITPKSIALAFPVSFLRVVVSPFTLWYKITTPIRILLERIANLFANLWTKGELKTSAHELDEDAVLHLIEEGQKEGVIEDIEFNLIKRALDLSDIPITKIMTPRDKIFYLSEDMSLDAIRRKLKEQRFSRIPVANKNGDFIGILYVRDLLPYIKEPQSFAGLNKLVRPPLFVPTKKMAYDFLREIKLKNAHIALAVNEYGDVVGLVTLDDILEALFGLKKIKGLDK